MINQYEYISVARHSESFYPAHEKYSYSRETVDIATTNFACNFGFVTAYALVLVHINEGWTSLKHRAQLCEPVRNVCYNSIKNDYHRCIGIGIVFSVRPPRRLRN